MIDANAISELLPDFLPRQRWFPHEDTIDSASVSDIEWVRDGDPALAWVLADVDGATYQIVVGARTRADLPEFLQGKSAVTLGEVDDWLLYDALIDPELAIDVLHRAAPGETATVARPLVVEQSNTSVVYDERLILKLFRRVHDEPNPDVEITRVLGDRGFPHVVPQVAELRRDGRDLAVVREYLLGATDGWHLAQTSLRDMFAARLPPEECGADFAPDAFRIGDAIASLHVALADVYGEKPGEPAVWLEGFRAQLDRIDGPFDEAAVAARFERVTRVADPGRSVRVHGDLHLGQVMQADTGWYVIDFEGEPARPVAERTRPSSPLRDVAGMMRSFHYAARSALLERFAEIDEELEELAGAWERRAFDAFSRGYYAVDGVAALLPETQADRDTITAAFELDKAVYEVGYELAHRPDWVAIPLAAIERVLGS